MEYQNAVFCLKYDGGADYQWLRTCLDTKCIAAAHLFGIKWLPEDLKIKITLLDNKKFYEQVKIYCAEIMDKEYCAFSTYEIFALDYEEVCQRYSPKQYSMIILHECIHVAQLYYSGVLPNKAIWFYEALAAGIAEQKARKPDIWVKWEEIKNHFYRVPGCYYIAYHLGKYLLRNFQWKEILEFCKNPEICEKDCHWYYTNKMINHLN